MYQYESPDVSFDIASPIWDEGVVRLWQKNDARDLTPEEFYSCLLYTSPSPRDKRQSRMPSSA